MGSVTREQCDAILDSYFVDKPYKLIDFHVKTASDASLGLMSWVASLIVKVTINDEEQEVRFFIKFLPQNDYHLGVVKKAYCFQKEAAFFGKTFSTMREFLLYKSIPECYLKDCDTMIVLEDLIMNGYKNCSNPTGFDLKHAYASIKALADIHAASLLFEHKVGKTLDKILSYEILRPWFSEIDDYPGYKDNLAAADVIGKVIDKYFLKYPENVKNKAKQFCKEFSKNMGTPSKKYPNVLSHQDLWCNNVMFKYNGKEEVEEAVIIDFQMYGYNPPTLDLLLLIYCTTDKITRDTNLDNLLEYYYSIFSENIQHHGVNPDSILSGKEFRASMEETKPLALTAAALYLHTVMVPEHEMFPVIRDIEKFKLYMEKDRSIVLEMLEKYEDYRARVLISVEDLLEFMSDK